MMYSYARSTGSLRSLAVAGCVAAIVIGGVEAKEWRARRPIPTEANLPSAPDQPRTRSCPAEPSADDPTTEHIDLTAEDIDVAPLPYGPRIAHEPLVAYARNRQELASALSELGDALTPCYRWARQRTPELEGTLAGQATIDAWGRIGAVGFDAVPATAEVASCLSGALLGRIVGEGGEQYTPRVTHVTFTVVLQRSGLGRPHGVAAPAATPMPPAPALCVLRPPTLPVDAWTSERPIVISDYDTD